MTAPRQQPAEQHNSFAGQGAVMLDIGGDVGALVVRMPSALAGQEVEIRPVDGSRGGSSGRLRHVAVLARSVASGVVHSAVFGQLPQGSYELYLRPSGPVRVTAAVRGGEVTFTDWAAG